MRYGLFALILGCILAQQAMGQALVQDKILLAYEFTKGEVLRYKVDCRDSMTVDTQTEDGPAEKEGIEMHSIAIVRIRVQKVLADGSAEITSSLESIALTVDGKKQSVDLKSVPAVRFSMQKTGAVKWLPAEKVPSLEDDSSPLMMALNCITDVILPGKEVKVGDAWDVSVKDYEVDEGKMDIPIAAALVSMGSMAAGVKSAEISIKATPEAASIPVKGAPMTASAQVEGKDYFSPERKCIVRTEGTATINVDKALIEAVGPFNEAVPVARGCVQIVTKTDYKAELLPN